MTETPDPENIDSPAELAQFVSDCYFMSSRAEGNRLQMELKDREDNWYLFDVAVYRDAPHGDQFVLQRKVGETLYRV